MNGWSTARTGERRVSLAGGTNRDSDSSILGARLHRRNERLSSCMTALLLIFGNNGESDNHVPCSRAKKTKFSWRAQASIVCFGFFEHSSELVVAFGGQEWKSRTESGGWWLRLSGRFDVKTFGFLEICDKRETYVNNDFGFRLGLPLLTMTPTCSNVSACDHLSSNGNHFVNLHNVAI